MLEELTAHLLRPRPSVDAMDPVMTRPYPLVLTEWEGDKEKLQGGT